MSRPPAGERLHKLLARHGLGSRRQVEDWIREGRVLVNGQPAGIGAQYEPGDKVVVDGRDVSRLLTREQRLRVIAYHKPSGEMLRRASGDDRDEVVANLPRLHGGRWIPINSLGYGEDGLLVLTNDGSLASAIARRGRELPVEYRVRALRPAGTLDWPEVPTEIEVEDQPVVFTAVERAGTEALNEWFRVAAERAVPRGAVRALFDAAGLKISRVLLVQWGALQLSRDLPRGRTRDIEGAELESLLALAGRTAVKPERMARTRGSAPKRRGGPRSGRRSAGR